MTSEVLSLLQDPTLQAYYAHILSETENIPASHFDSALYFSDEIGEPSAIHLSRSNTTYRPDVNQSTSVSVHKRRSQLLATLPYPLTYRSRSPSVIPNNTKQVMTFILNHLEQNVRSSYFQPTYDQYACVRDNMASRLYRSKPSLWIRYLGCKIMECAQQDTGGQSSSVYERSLQKVESYLHSTSSQNLGYDELYNRLAGVLEIGCTKLMLSANASAYQVLQDVAPTFIQLVFTDPTLWFASLDFSSVCVGHILGSTNYELAKFIQLDALHSMVYGLPQVIEYDTSAPPPKEGTWPSEWIHGCPIELQFALIDINKHCNSRTQILPQPDWRRIEDRIKSWTPRVPAKSSDEAWKAVAMVFIQESWRHALLIYLYMLSSRILVAGSHRNLVRGEQSAKAVESNKVAKIDQKKMEEVLKCDLYGQVYLHNSFFKEFFAWDPDIQDNVRRRIETQLRPNGTSLLEFTDGRWAISEQIVYETNEAHVYDPLAEMLNIVGRTAYDVYRDHHPQEQFRHRYHPFVDFHRRRLEWDTPSDASTSPDLVMAPETGTHWADVELIIECKSSSETGNRHDSLLQLTRYARVVFAHQIYRLRVFGFSLCGSIANFVCFDRSGLLHSRDIDLSKPEDADLFITHIITLLTLPPEKFGYDTRFSFRRAQVGGRDVTETLFKFGDQEPNVVSELLCHRKCCCGRATCVCALGDNVLKSIWRPENRSDEGETLALFEGVFGVCQVRDFSHGMYSTKLNHLEDLELSPFASFFNPRGKSKAVSGPSTSSFHSQSGSALRMSTDPHASEAPAISDPEPVVSVSRGVRIKSDILMPQGISLFDTQNPLHLLMAIHDALLGIMAFTEAGMIHCDISAYNLLLINPATHYKDSNWMNAPKVQANPSKRDYNARGTNSYDVQRRFELLINLYSTSPRLQRIAEWGRGPVCVVHDTEFTISEDRKKDEVHSDRTGTPAFISIQLLESYMGNTTASRGFIHDAESLLWVLIWTVAHRSVSEERWEITPNAEKIIRQLSKLDISDLCEHKLNMISDGQRLRDMILEMETDLADGLAEVIGRLADFFYTYLYSGHKTSRTGLSARSHFKRGPQSDPSAGAAVGPKRPIFTQPSQTHQARHMLHKQYIEESRTQTFNRLFDILNEPVTQLKEWYSLPVC
ncbi:phosphoribosylformylglycinamidine synthase [Ceratobasidium sp. AG-Ba]|nr:phosphoribosylformylglycinamidine synthase [Ceratobasidium sp. AG-Ba]QRV91747.1 phosphoribosylformylglycinamidine synthase [Ceratobasidium sp. AG-Ba]